MKIDPEAIIPHNNFCYSYCRACVDHLMHLATNNELFIDKEIEKESLNHARVTNIAVALITIISQQTNLPSPALASYRNAMPALVIDFIKDADNILKHLTKE